MNANGSHRIAKPERDEKENQLIKKKIKQAGIGFPSAGKQEHLMIIRLDLARRPPDPRHPDLRRQTVRDGLRRLCTFFDQIERGKKKIEKLNEDGTVVLLPLSEFAFSATIAFGIGFFEKLEIANNKRPRKLREMPDHTYLGDVLPYSLGQTDLLIQLGANDAFVNEWVRENTLRPMTKHDDAEQPPDIVSAVRGWATITDVHTGFQRMDGRNLQGFNDGVSNPRRLSRLFDQIVWTSKDDERPDLANGSYMVFQKIVHDLDQWRTLGVDEQQEWVGRTKGTGLVLGTLDEADDEKLARDLQSDDDAVRAKATARWKTLFQQQADPKARLFDHEGGDIDGTASFKVGGTPTQIPLRCPAWSHIRKANPRNEDGKIPQHLIFRRGYPFMQAGLNNRTVSGLLFVCFQRDIAAGFEYIKQMCFNNKSFPTPGFRPFSKRELELRHTQGRFSKVELNALTQDQRKFLGLDKKEAFDAAVNNASEDDTQNTGREGLAGPSELGVTPTGQLFAIQPLGGGYYFVPPIPNRSVAEIGQQFF